MRSATPRQVGLLLVCLAAFWPAAAGLAADSPDLHPLDLPGTPSLAAPITPPRSQASAFLEEVAVKSGRSIIVLGRLSLSAELLRALDGKPAREVMKAFADTVHGDWMESGGFFLLYPSDMERHDARPVQAAKTYPEFRRKLSGTLSDDLMGLVLEAGSRTGLTLHVVGPGASPKAQIRSMLPCIAVLRDVTVDDFMGALTALTGDPWHHHHNFHLLSFTGKPLTEDDLAKVQGPLAGLTFRRSLTPRQQQQIASDDGLPAAQLTPDQRRNLDLSTALMRRLSGAGVDELVLKRLHVTETTFSEWISLYARGTYIGEMRGK